MPNKKTLALTKEQYAEIITATKDGFTGFRANERTATALTLEANLGLRISDILSLTVNSIIKDGNRYRLDLIEQKTGKPRQFTVPAPIYDYIRAYAERNSIADDEPLFDLTERAIQKNLAIVCAHLGIEGISTHSFRKFFATSIYENSGYDVRLVQELLQHSSPATTSRYLGISSKQTEAALAQHICLI